MRIRIRLITPHADPDSEFYLMLMRIPDPNTNFYPDTDPDPSFQIKAQTLENVLK
jgi:hypothetical protein